jgi:putative phosphonate metabolism protein
MKPAPRYALYWAPPNHTPLSMLGSAWLGRDTEDQAVPARPLLDGFDPARLAALTAEPRRYGLHATLKPPFALADRTDLATLRADLAAFAAAAAPVLLPKLQLRRLDRFLALVLSAPCPALDSLAARCVTEFDRFRRPAPSAELARRRAAGLDPAEEAHLLRWGYPYVLDRFRFHVSLTGPLDAAEAERLVPPLAALFEPATRRPIPLEDIALFAEPETGAPFQLIERIPLRGSPG